MIGACVGSGAMAGEGVYKNRLSRECTSIPPKLGRDWAGTGQGLGGELKRW